ncbi:MAG TPA: hypothetical protein VFD63_17455 [Pyrinomonadaceae bacterium]|jgi:hypothetical protein|nr:hypothetical protein [Pyrinomonadaceae bacterium]
MGRNNGSQKECKHFGRHVWKIVVGLALAAVAAGVVASLPDIKRYIRITRM